MLVFLKKKMAVLSNSETRFAVERALKHGIRGRHLRWMTIFSLTGIVVSEEDVRADV